MAGAGCRPDNCSTWNRPRSDAEGRRRRTGGTRGHDRRTQSEGRGRQDRHRHQPRRLPRRTRPARADGGLRSPAGPFRELGPRRRRAACSGRAIPRRGERRRRRCAVRDPARRRRRLAPLPTAYEALRSQTARLLDPANRDLAALLARLRGRFDVVLIDTPAGDTVFGRQAMTAADEAIVPMLPGYHELRALTRVLDLLDARAQDAAAEVGLLGVLLVDADQRWRSTREHGEHLATMAREHEIEFFHVIVPRHQPVTEHARYGRPTALLRPRSTVAIAYRELAREVIERLNARHASVKPARPTLEVQR